MKFLQHNQKKFFINSCGFTMVETVMYVALISLAIGSFIGFGSHISDLRAKVTVFQDVELNGRNIFSQIDHYTKKADNVFSPMPGDAAQNSLELDMPEADPDIVFYESNGDVYLTEGAGSPIKLNSDGVEVVGLLFENSSQVGKKDVVEIELNLKYRYDYTTAYQYENQFKGTIALRY